MDIRERRAMILAAQHLTRPAAAAEVCRDLNGLQAQVFSAACHALAIRRIPSDAAESYRDLVKTWTVRGTMHLLHAEDLPLFLHRERTHFLRDVDRLSGDRWVSGERKAYFSALILELIDGGITRREALRQACREAGMQESEEESLFNSWGGLLRAMSEEGLICYAPTEEKTFRRCPPFVPMERDKARLEQARRYFTHFGPATVKDAAYYFACPQKDVKLWLEQLPVQADVCGGREVFWIGSGEAAPIPHCILLAGFDQLLLGYEKKESIFLPPEHLRSVFSLSGAVSPCVLLDGQIAARWKVKGKQVQVAPFRPLTPQEEESIRRQVSLRLPEVKTVRLENA